jgi:hypothetical protein
VPVQPRTPRRIGLTTGFSTLEGRVAIYDPNKSFVPDVTVPGSIAVNMWWQKSMMGVRGSRIQLTEGDEARYRFLGVAPVSAYPRLLSFPTAIAAFKIDDATGEITYAPQFGAFGDEEYPTWFDLKQAYRSSPIVVFPCQAVDFYDLMDPQELRILESVTITEATADAKPREYSMSWGVLDMRMSSEAEHNMVLYGPPQLTFKLIFGSEFGETRLPLIGATAQKPNGAGFRLGDLVAGGGIMPHTSLQAARDLVLLNGSRMDQFARYRIISEGVDTLHRQAQEELSEA